MHSDIMTLTLAALECMAGIDGCVLLVDLCLSEWKWFKRGALKSVFTSVLPDLHAGVVRSTLGEVGVAVSGRVVVSVRGRSDAFVQNKTVG